ncbi:MAG: hypothetical protein K6T66_06930 [Peptococcaceae bacterium]|nr:hypothetical protein [Peptococcaceae bacterium]
MKRTVAALMAAIILLSGVFQAGCSGTAGKPPESKPSKEAPKAQEQPPGQKPPEQRPPAVKPGQYFPLALGTVWEYLGEGNEYASFTREVIFTAGNRAQVREDNGGTVMAVIYEVTDEAATRVFSQGEVYDRVNLLDRPQSERTVILKAPLQVGTKWKDPNGEREIVDVNAAVNTPAGKFEKCIKVKIGGKDSTLYEYYREGVGLVKREFISGETRVTSTLKKFSPGKG